jgi:hypothetical protein
VRTRPVSPLGIGELVWSEQALATVPRAGATLAALTDGLVDGMAATRDFVQAIRAGKDWTNAALVARAEACNARSPFADDKTLIVLRG